MRFSRSSNTPRWVMPTKGASIIRGRGTATEEAVATLRHELDAADAILVGAGAGLSTAAGFTYSGERFDEHFADFRDAFGITDMYSGGFYPFPDQETYWAWWSRFIWLNRYETGVGQPYLDLMSQLTGRDYFVLTTNVDHQFQKAGIDKDRLFYTQGDYGLFQCARNCSGRTYDNEELVRLMVEDQHDMRIPTELIPRCPDCGEPLVPNLRVDESFCEDKGWHAAAARYQAWREAHRTGRVLYLELGVGGNTPGIIKYPFWQAVADNSQATYVCVNRGEAFAPGDLSARSILIDANLATAVRNLMS